MSNSQVGSVYQQIIADVVESSRVDFEEGGVDENVLEELRQGWQKKLSGLQVANFPWDPKPEPITNPPTVPSNAGNYQHAMSTPPITQPQPALSMPLSSMPSNNSANGPRIKAEPGLDTSGPGMSQAPYNPTGGMANNTTAQQRAAQNLQATYGSRAAASIDAIRGGAVQQQQNPQNMQQVQQQQQQHMQQMLLQQHRSAGPPIQRPQMTHEQYRQATAMQAAQAQQRIQSQNGVNGAQTDGARDEAMGESVGVIKRYNARGEEELMGRIEVDHMIRNKIESMGQGMEGGGLMLPLHNKKSTTQNKRQRKPYLTSSGPVPQLDGPDDDDDEEDDKANVLKHEELDEDAINSDLDDPDDGLNDEEDDDEGMGHIMLCMYDKVQRVKNKWKCVMKDGVLTVNGKEYVFHKASGEYEW